MSSTSNHKYVTTEHKGKGYAVVTIKREPVNSMNMDVWKELLATLDACESDKAVRGIIIQSGVERDVFTAGNDINELFAPNTSEQRYKQFWATSNTFLSRLYSSPLITIAAIRGACPAGGCILSLCCDYRIMSIEGNPRIGLNEVALGIPVPTYWIEVMTRLIGFSQTEQLLMKGIMPTSSEAQQIGLIHRTAPSADLIGVAEIEMQQRLTFSDVGRIPTKLSMRKDLSDGWVAAAGQESSAAWQRLSSPQTVKSLEAVLARLAGNKQKQKAKL